MRRFSTERTEVGHTLVEVMIASSLVLLIFYGFVAILFAIWRNHELNMLKSELQDQTILAFSRITQELAESASATVATAPDGVVFASPRDQDGDIDQDSDGRLKWQKFVAFYVEVVDGVPVVLRKEKPIPPSDRSTDPPPPTGVYSLAAIRADTLETRQVAHDVAELKCNRLGEFVEFQVVVKKFYPRQNRDYTMLTKFGFTVRN